MYCFNMICFLNFIFFIFHLSLQHIRFGTMASKVIKTKFYEMTSIKLGVEVNGIDLSQDVAPDVIEQIKKDVTEHR